MKASLQQLFAQAISTLQQQQILSNDISAKIIIERTKDKSFGDYACNLAMMLAKQAKMPPRDLAAKIITALPDNPVIEKTDIAGPGFINIFLAAASSQAVISQILQQGKNFGRNQQGQGKKVQVEFVSANPTGPLHVGHGRGAAVGDSICRLLAATGWDVCAEFYYNDAGQQIKNLGLSTQARCKGLGPDDNSWPEDGYRGDYITELAQSYMAGETIHAEDRSVKGAADADNLDAITEFAVAYLRREQDADLKAFKVDFDVYFLESSLYSSGAVAKTVEDLIASGHTYEKDGALWLRSTDFGDDKDRVMRKKDGGYTYFVPDVAYHKNKWQRGFSTVINEQGADHHSTVTRVRAGLQALDIGIPKGWPDYVLHQMVMVMRGGEEVKISKRAGSYLTLRDLIDEVGCDATRYFLLARAPSSQLTFDIDLAISKSNENPVYYIQYAHARVCSVMRKLAEQGLDWQQGHALSQLEALTLDSEKELMNKLAAYPEVISLAAQRFEPHALANYLKELAADYHSYYNANKVLVNDEAQRNARIALAQAVRQVIANGLDLLGVSQPEQM